MSLFFRKTQHLIAIMSKDEGVTPTLLLGLNSYSFALLVLPSAAWQCREKDVENNKSTDLFRASPFLRISLLISCQGKKNKTVVIHDMKTAENINYQ